MIPQITCSHRSFKNEKQFQSFLTKVLHERGFFVEKLSDQAMWYKACDMFFMWEDWILAGVEVKYHSINDGTTFNRKKIRPNQYSSLRRLSQGNEKSALLVIYFEKYKTYKVFTFNEYLSLIWDRKSFYLSEIFPENVENL